VVLVLVLGGQVTQVLVLVLVLGGQVLVLVLVLGGQVLVNIPTYYQSYIWALIDTSLGSVRQSLVHI